MRPHERRAVYVMARVAGAVRRKIPEANVYRAPAPEIPTTSQYRNWSRTLRLLWLAGVTVTVAFPFAASVRTTPLEGEDSWNAAAASASAG